MTVYYSVAITLLTPKGMIQSRTQILMHIAGRKSDRRITCETHHGCNLVREIRHDRNSSSDRFILKQMIRAPRKVTSELTVNSDHLARRDPRLRCRYPACVSENSADSPRVSKSRVQTIPHDLHFLFRPLILMFLLTTKYKSLIHHL
jgi:hypothetical protein